MEKYKKEFIQPTLIKQLKNILNQYPDNDQILKELIQNAEDAGAHEVKFLYDSREWGTKTLFHPKLRRFQGAALYAYNDARFTEKDWEGIRTLCDSIKADDPAKVGRFGLGFKSVFHLTDLPSIISGEYVGFQDPHKFTKGSAWHFPLNEVEADTFAAFSQPVCHIADLQSVFKEGHYEHTLFRFPLRQQPSKLSSTLYSKARIDVLFEMFHDTGQLTLLFLRNIEKIQLYVEQEEVLNIHLDENTIERVRPSRESFWQKIDAQNWMEHPSCMTDIVQISTERNNNIQRGKWLVCHYYAGGGDFSDELKHLHSEEKLLPLVGVAFNLKSDKEIKHRKGHVFCALPLPLSLEEKGLTGFPFHINGHFALDQSRSQLKWPSGNQDLDKCLDKDVRWNQCLIREVLPKALVQLVLKAVDLQCQRLMSVSDVYRLIPDVKNVTDQWKPMVEVFFHELFRQVDIFHCSANIQGKGNWFGWHQVLFTTESDTLAKLLTKIMAVSDKPVTDAPIHLHQALENAGKVLHYVTAPLTRKALHVYQEKEKVLNRKEKLAILKYVFPENDEDVPDLKGLELVPMADGLFEVFGSSKHILLPNQKHPARLLPGVEKKLIDIACLKTENLLQGFERLVDKGIKHIGPNWIPKLDKDWWASLVHEVFPEDWQTKDMVFWTPGQSGHPPKKWIEETWQYLLKHFPKTLPPELNGLHLLETKDRNTCMLVQLTENSPVVLSKWGCQVLDPAVKSLLKKINVRVCETLPHYVTFHKGVWKKYIEEPNSVGILRAMNKLGVKTVVHKLRKEAQAKELTALANMFINDLPHETECIQLMKKLPLLLPISDSKASAADDRQKKKYVSAEELPRAFNKLFKFGGNCASKLQIVLPVPLPEKFLPAPDYITAKFYDILDIEVLDVETIMTQHIIPGTRQHPEQIEVLGLHILDNLDKYRKAGWDADTILSSFPFVKTTAGIRKRPKELLDPDDVVVTQLIKDEGLLPNQNKTRLRKLKRIGLRSSSQLQPDEIIMALECVKDNAEMLAMFMQLLEKNPRYMDMPHVSAHLDKESWVMPETRPKDKEFPPSLCWQGDSIASGCKPSDVVSSVHKSLVGAVHPMINVTTFKNLACHYQWTTREGFDLGDVVKQLDIVTKSYNKEEKEEKIKYMNMLQEIYAYLTNCSRNNVHASMSCIGLTDWVWTGNGFSCPEKMMLEKSLQNTRDFAPHVYTLPDELVKYKTFFKSNGVREHIPLEDILKYIQNRHESPSACVQEADIKNDLQICSEVLSSIVDDDNDDEIPPDLLVPIHTPDGSLKMIPLDKCTYCDSTFIRDMFDNDGEEDSEDGEEDTKKKKVPTATLR